MDVNFGRDASMQQFAPQLAKEMPVCHQLAAASAQRSCRVCNAAFLQHSPTSFLPLNSSHVVNAADFSVASFEPRVKALKSSCRILATLPGCSECCWWHSSHHILCPLALERRPESPGWRWRRSGDWDCRVGVKEQMEH